MGVGIPRRSPLREFHLLKARTYHKCRRERIGNLCVCCNMRWEAWSPCRSSGDWETQLSTWLQIIDNVDCLSYPERLTTSWSEEREQRRSQALGNAAESSPSPPPQRVYQLMILVLRSLSRMWGGAIVRDPTFKWWAWGLCEWSYEFLRMRWKYIEKENQSWTRTVYHLFRSVFSNRHYGYSVLYML